MLNALMDWHGCCIYSATTIRWQLIGESKHGHTRRKDRIRVHPVHGRSRRLLCYVCFRLSLIGDTKMRNQNFQTVTKHVRINGESFISCEAAAHCIMLWPASIARKAMAKLLSA